jgi:uncharacterized protein (TIGR03437 family)
MKSILAVAVSLTVWAPLASAVAFGPTNQSVTLTGLGGNASGEGQDRITLGSCVFGGTTTVCTLTAPLTGPDAGGTISTVLTYAGNGPSPLTSGSQSPGSNLLNPASLSSGNVVTTVTLSSGTILTFNGQIPGFLFNQTGDPSAQCTGVTTCNVGQVGLVPGATITGEVSGTFNTLPVIMAVENAATYQVKSTTNPATPNSIISVYVSNLGAVSAANLFPATNYQGVEVLFNGTAAPLYYVNGADNLINLAVPSNLPTTGTATLNVQTVAGLSADFTLPLGPTDTGVFRLPADPTYANNGAVTIANSLWLVVPAATATAYGLTSCTGLQPVNSCGQPAAAGSNIVIYLTGGGLATPNGNPSGQPVPTGSIAPANGSTIYDTVQTPTVTIGGISAPVAFSGIAPGNAAEYQINTTIPMGVQSGNSVPVVVTFGSTSDTVTIAVQ